MLFESFLIYIHVSSDTREPCLLFIMSLIATSRVFCNFFYIYYWRVFICKIKFLDEMTIVVMCNPGTNNFLASILIVTTNKLCQDYLFMFSCFKFVIVMQALVSDNHQECPSFKGGFPPTFCFKGPQ